MIVTTTSFRHTFVTNQDSVLSVAWTQVGAISKVMVSVVHFPYGRHINSFKYSAIRYIETTGRKSSKRDAAVCEFFLCCGHGLGYTSCIFGSHTTYALWGTGRTAGQYRNDADSSQSFSGRSNNLDRAIRSTSWGNPVATKKPNPASLIFSTLDPICNDVTLYTETWNEHIVIGHVEMVGLDALVRQAVEDPYQIRQSTIN
jgi:hypothetical protein